MKQAMSLYFVVLALFVVGLDTLGFAQMLLVAYGAISVMALLISGTFFWLWQVRATPLALGMSLSWAGSGLTIGWWWLMQVAGNPAWGTEAAIVFCSLALLTAGAVLHFAVIQGSLGYHGIAFLLPVFAALALSLGVLAMI